MVRSKNNDAKEYLLNLRNIPMVMYINKTFLKELVNNNIGKKPKKKEKN